MATSGASMGAMSAITAQSEATAIFAAQQQASMSKVEAINGLTRTGADMAKSAAAR